MVAKVLFISKVSLRQEGVQITIQCSQSKQKFNLLSLNVSLKMEWIDIALLAGKAFQSG